MSLFSKSLVCRLILSLYRREDEMDVLVWSKFFMRWNVVWGNTNKIQTQICYGVINNRKSFSLYCTILCSICWIKIYNFVFDRSVVEYTSPNEDWRANSGNLAPTSKSGWVISTGGTKLGFWASFSVFCFELTLPASSPSRACFCDNTSFFFQKNEIYLHK